MVHKKSKNLAPTNAADAFDGCFEDREIEWNILTAVSDAFYIKNEQ